MQSSSFVNLRDLGGLPLHDGSRVAEGTLLRSDAPWRLTARDVEAFGAIPLGEVLDLRDDEEVAEAPSAFAACGFAVRRVPVFAGSARSVVEGLEGGLRGLYERMLQDSGPMLVAAVTRIVHAATGAVLVHCTVGKDRTGMVVALALSAAGVRREAVVEDFARTQANLTGPWLERRVALLSSVHGRDLSGSAQLLAGSPPGLMEDVLGHMDARWGSPLGFLLAHGLDARDADLLRHRLTAVGVPA